MTTNNDDILIKLFDTLKESTNRNTAATDVLIKQQLDLVSYMKTLPICELKDSLKDHGVACNINHEKSKNNIDEKNDTVIKELGLIKDKIKTMITVVIVAFTILCGTYVTIRTTIDNSRIESIVESIDNHQEYILEEFIKKLKPDYKIDKDEE